MKTSLMPPGLVVVSTRIGRVGQSSAAAPNAVQTNVKAVAAMMKNERRTIFLSLHCDFIDR
jgi:hypothetical protein